MKKVKLLLSVALVTSLAFISSCSKDDEANLSKKELLTQKPWKLQSTTIVGLPSSPPDSFQADDTFTFATDGTYTFDEGATKEDPSDPQTQTGTWEFAENETVIKLTYGGITINQEIVELTTSTLKVKFNFLLDFENVYSH